MENDKITIGKFSWKAENVLKFLLQNIEKLTQHQKNNIWNVENVKITIGKFLWKAIFFSNLF